MEFSSPRRGLKWAHKPTRRSLQNSSSCTHYLHRLDFSEMVFRLLPLVPRISQLQISITGKCVDVHLHQCGLRGGIQHLGLAHLDVGRANTDCLKCSIGASNCYRTLSNSIHSFVSHWPSPPITACAAP